jgi:tetratricopeptide (TPR) repeat protein
MTNPCPRRQLLVAAHLLLLLAATSANAGIDPELKTPYQLRVVLHVAEHRMLTAQFQARLADELRSQLQLAFGKLANVEVVRAHPLLDEIRSKGMQAVLDGWDELSAVQTHFVFVEFDAGQYQIETGSHDGLTGLSSRAVRRAAFGDWQRVPDAAVAMVRKGFAVGGSFDRVDGQEVQVALKGGGLCDSLDAWVKPGDVFAVVRVSSAGGQQRGTLVDMAVLRAMDSPENGLVRCRYFYRWASDRTLPDAGDGAGYRCVRLDAKKGPVRVRLVHDKTLEPLDSLRVLVSSNEDFTGEMTEGVAINGSFEAVGPYSNVAFVRVKSGASVLAQFPLPLMDDRAMVCRLLPSANAQNLGEIEQRRERWVRSHLEALQLADQRMLEYNTKIAAPRPTKMSLTEALKLGRRHLAEMEAESKRLDAEKKDLLVLAGKVKVATEEGDQYGDAMYKRQRDMAKSLADLDKALQAADSEKTHAAIAMHESASLKEKAYEFDQAIELYEKVVKETDSAEVKAHLKTLKEQWALSGPQHEAARRFVYEEWAKLVDLASVLGNLEKARQSLQVLKAAGDLKTPLKLRQANRAHATALLKELDVLKRAPHSEDVQTRLKALLPLVTSLNDFQRETEAWIKSKQ